MKKTIVINLIGGPGVGKSTIASGVFYELKKLGVNCELALEFAKDKVYEESYKTMDDQIYIFAKQYHKLWRLINKVDVIITNSPLLISLHYMKESSKYFADFVIEQYEKFDNRLYFIKRATDDYQTEGRIQTLDEAKTIDISIKNILKEKGNMIVFSDITRENAVNKIVDDLKRDNTELFDEMVKEEIDFWDIVKDINWGYLCRTTERPYNKAKEILKNFGFNHEKINDMLQKSQTYRRELQDAIRKYSEKNYGNKHIFPPRVSDDGFWDLTAHIVGLGKETYYDILNYPEKIKPYADKHNYVENFEYCFHTN